MPLNAVETDLICRTPMFGGVPTDKIATLIAGAGMRSFDRGEILFLQDEPATHFFFILDGWIKIFRMSPQGEESIIHVFTRGDTFAEAAIFASVTFPVTAQAAELSRVLAIPAGPFLSRLRDDPELCFNIMASMSRHLRRLVSQLEQLTTKSSVQRLAEFLLRLSPEATGSIEISLPVDKSLIAGRLGMQPETLSRSLSKLRSVGVETRKDHIFIEDVDTLRRFTED
jgi:CRP-like cAMP-binding protein